MQLELHDQIRIAREAAGLTQEELAARVNVSKTAVGYWESGENKPRIDKLKQIEKALGAVFDPTGAANQRHGDLAFTTNKLDANALDWAVRLSRLPEEFQAPLRELTYAISNRVASDESINKKNVNVVIRRSSADVGKGRSTSSKRRA